MWGQQQVGRCGAGAPRGIGGPREARQHLCHRVRSVAGSGFLTFADIKCDVGATLARTKP